MAAVVLNLSLLPLSTVSAAGNEDPLWGPTYLASGSPGDPVCAPPSLFPHSCFIPVGNTVVEVATGPTVYPDGSVLGRWTANDGGAITGLAIGHFGLGFFLFVSTADGFLYRVNESDLVTENRSVDTRRNGDPILGTCLSDALDSAPVVQSFSQSNATFQNAMSAAGHKGDDLVIVGTYTQCGDATSNRIIAYFASDLTPAWVVNFDGSLRIGRSVAPCGIDYDTNIAFCGTLSPGYGENTIWALDTIATDSSRVVWSANVGDVTAAPALGYAGQHVYVPAEDANGNADLLALDPAGDGAGGARTIWSVGNGWVVGPVSHPLAVASASGKNWVAMTTGPVCCNPLTGSMTGFLGVVADAGNAASVQWTDSVCRSDCDSAYPYPATAPIILPDLGLIEIGEAVSGEVYECNLNFPTVVPGSLFCGGQSSIPWGGVSAVSLVADPTSSSLTAPDRALLVQAQVPTFASAYEFSLPLNPPGVLTATSAPIVSTEGQQFSGAVAGFTDSNTLLVAGDFGASIDWSDGSTTSGTITGSNGSFAVSGTHTYAEEGSYQVKVTITANLVDGPVSASTTDTASVADAAMTLAAQTFPASPTVPFSGPVAVLTDLNPGGASADYTATIDWGDGSQGTGAISAGPSGVFSVNGSHTYAQVGSFPVAVTVRDAGGSSAAVTSTAVVTEADLSLALSASSGQIKSGSNLIYTASSKNHGPTAASTVAVTDMLPALSQFVSISASGWSCNTPAMGSTGAVSCTRSSLANGASASVQITVKIVATGRTTVSDTATVKSNTFDPKTSSNSASVATSVYGP